MKVKEEREDVASIASFTSLMALPERGSLSPAQWFEGGFSDYEENRKKRLGGDVVPHRIVQEIGAGLIRCPGAQATCRSESLWAWCVRW